MTKGSPAIADDPILLHRGDNLKLGQKVGSSKSIDRTNPKFGKQRDTGAFKQKSSRAVSFGKRTGALIVSALIVLSSFGAAIFLMNQQAEKVTVVRLKNDIGPGALITEASIEPYDMVNEDYLNLGMQTSTQDGNASESGQTFIKWADREDILNKYMSIYAYQGTILSTRMVVDDLLVRSPWIEGVDEGMEIYTMGLTSQDVYTPIFYPGAQIRIRLVYNVDVEDAPAIKAKIDAKEAQMAAGTYFATGESVIMDSMQQNEMDSSEIGFTSGNAKQVPLSEVIFDKITVVDMLNNSDESIFDLYTELLGMPVEDRIAYVSTQIEGNGTNDFKRKVTPAKLVFSVTRDEATSLAEFEALGGNMKYTLLPDNNEDYSLMTQFSELSSQIQSWMDNAPTSSFN